MFGEKWSDVALVFPGACLALLVAGAAVNPAVSYFWAANRPDIVLRAACLNAVTVIVASVALLPVLDLMAIGASLAAGAAESLSFLCAPPFERKPPPTLPVPVAAASAGAAVGWVVATANSPCGCRGGLRHRRRSDNWAAARPLSCCAR